MQIETAKTVIFCKQLIYSIFIAMKKYIFLSVVFVGLLSFGCKRKKEASLPSPNKSEVKEIQKQLEVKIKRYDKALYSIPKDSLGSSLEKLQKEYAFFIPENPSRPEIADAMREHLNTNKQLYEAVQTKFADLTDLEKQFAEAFSLLRYYFPDASLPQIYTFVSGLDYEHFVMYYGDTLLIPLDLFLGKDYKLYKRLGSEVPQYIKRRFSREYILPTCLGEISYKYISAKPLQSNLLDAMLLEGKFLLFLEMMLPSLPDSLLFPFPQEKIQWAKDNEANIWAYLIQNNYLYSRDKTVMRKLVGEAALTSYFGNDSPGRVGAWIGWQICRSWVEKNPQKKIAELFAETDAQKILTASKYKPPK